MIQALLTANTAPQPPVAEPKTGTSSTPGAAAAVTAVAGDPNDPKAHHDPGVYLYEEVDGKRKMTKLKFETPNIHHSGGVAVFVSFGGSTATLSGLSAKLQLKTRRPIFYMYLGKVNIDSIDDDKTPAELPLVQFDVKNTKKVQQRSVVIASSGGGPYTSGGSIGLPDKYKRSFDEEKLAPGVFKVVPEADLVDGEYAFVHVGNEIATMLGRMFSFGIHSE